MAQADSPGFRITGWHVLAIFVGAFGTIIAVNILLAVQAVRTFPGLEVKNSYVASQTFDIDRAAQERLGWSIRADEADGQIRLAISDRNGAPVQVRDLHAVVGRATQVADDVEPVFAWDGGAYVAPLELSGGQWHVRLTALAEDGTMFKQRIVLHVKR
ncbi:FixH family protein [Pseudooceanicola sp.]|uniref:FixH family protein n=1 Tax=Pseudooceanicola sp. TaxID=1914328 RepID=UPI00260ADABD|nr:FixH family protein [Pseudooceanicola sp.]MDF1854566.1 FixH family protein [Pseudooceanicola sp.]